MAISHIVFGGDFMIKICLIVFSVIYCFVYIILAAKTKKPLRTIFVYSALGILGITAVNLTTVFTGIYIPVNKISVGISLALGLPGTVGLLISKMIFL